MNQIKEVYARIHADGPAVDAAIEKAKKQKITHFPAHRVAAIAAGFVVVIVAAGAVIFALQPKTDTSAYMPYEEADAGGAMEAVPEADEDKAADGAGYSAGSAVQNDIEVISAVDHGDELTVVYSIRTQSGYEPEHIALKAEDENGTELTPLGEERVLSQDSWDITARFEPAAPQRITCKFYDGETLIREQTVTVEEP